MSNPWRNSITQIAHQNLVWKYKFLLDVENLFTGNWSLQKFMRWSVKRTSSCENAANVFQWDKITRDMNHPQCAIYDKSQEKPPCRMCVTKREVMPFDALTLSLWPFCKRAHFFPSLILLWDKARVEVIFFSVAFLHTYRKIPAYDANRTYSEQALFYHFGMWLLTSCQLILERFVLGKGKGPCSILAGKVPSVP